MKIDKKIAAEINAWLSAIWYKEQAELRSISIQERRGRNSYSHLVKFGSKETGSMTGFCIGFMECHVRSNPGSKTYRLKAVAAGTKTHKTVEKIKRIRYVDPYEGDPSEELLEERAGYNIMKVTMPGPDGGTEIVGAFTKRGDYIGDVAVAERLVDRIGIAPEMVSRESSVCTIGFCEGEDRWYGWSHRAIAGFGIGDKIYDEEFDRDDVPPQQHGFGGIENMRHARVAAIRYEECVS